MISRVAENVYWMERYAERASGTARLLQTAMSVLVDVPGLPWWTPVLVVAGEQPEFEERFGLANQEDGEAVMNWLTWDEDCRVSIVRSVEAARENARTTRDAVSREIWETINSLYLWLCSDEARQRYDEDRVGFYAHVVNVGYSLLGAATFTMLRAEALGFLKLGRALERAEQTARALDVKYHMLGPTESEVADTSADTVVWLATLLSCSAYEAYFKRNRGSVRGRRVARLLLLDAAVPTSVICCLGDARSALVEIEGSSAPSRATSRRVQALLASLEAANIDELVSEGIHHRLTSIVEGLAEIAALLYTDFFDPPIRGDVVLESASQ